MVACQFKGIQGYVAAKNINTAKTILLATKNQI